MEPNESGLSSLPPLHPPHFPSSTVMPPIEGGKRKRGRPRKEKNPEDNQQPEGEKRKIGRPRKYKNPEAQETQVASPAVEAAMTREEEMNSIITELKLNCTVLQENLAKEESEKLDALECYRRETEAKVTAEKLQASLREELGKVEQEKLSANQKVVLLNDINNKLQEYSTSLQQYNMMLQTDLATANESLKRVENEKVTIVQNLSTVMSHSNALQDQLTASKETCSSQREQIHLRQHQLAAAIDKLKVGLGSVVTAGSEYKGKS